MAGLYIIMVGIRLRQALSGRRHAAPLVLCKEKGKKNATPAVGTSFSHCEFTPQPGIWIFTPTNSRLSLECEFLPLRIYAWVWNMNFYPCEFTLQSGRWICREKFHVPVWSMNSLSEISHSSLEYEFASRFVHIPDWNMKSRAKSELQRKRRWILPSMRAPIQRIILSLPRIKKQTFKSKKEIW